MPTGKIQTVGDLIKEALPKLSIGHNTTNSHALHKEHFVGKLAEWTNFEKDVRATCCRVNWNQKRHVLCHTTVGTPPRTHT